MAEDDRAFVPGVRRRGCIAALLASPTLYRVLARPQKVLAIALVVWFVFGNTTLLVARRLKPWHFDPARAPWVYLHVAGNVLCVVGAGYLLCAILFQALAGIRQSYLFRLAIALLWRWLIWDGYHNAVFLLPPHTLPEFDQIVPAIARPIDAINTYFPVWFSMLLLYMLHVAAHPRVRQRLREMQRQTASSARRADTVIVADVARTDLPLANAPAPWPDSARRAIGDGMRR